MDNWNSRRSPVVTRNGVCCSNEPTASAIGAKILTAGGNAADAAVAIAAALNVLQPCMSGLGGDSFALFYDSSTKEVHCLQGNGASSSNISLEVVNAAGYGLDMQPLDPASGLCVTVPGAAALWDDLAKTHGSLPLSTILAPAIKLADEGFPLSPITASHWNGRLNAEGERVLRPNGRPPNAGEVLRNPDLAETMRSIAKSGAHEGYYQGRIAEAIVEAVQARGGVLDLEDLKSHRTKFVKPISIDYKGVRVFETPPPSQGLSALIALRLIEKVEQLRHQELQSAVRDVRTPNQPLKFAADRAKRSSVDDTHLLLECMRVACAEALHHITDPLMTPVPTEQLLSDAYITAAAEKICLQQSSVVRATDYSAFRHGETAYLCCVDAQGNACSMICSNYQGFGTGIMPLDCGFTLQNRGLNFSLQPGHPNQLLPNKRPYHTIIPSMLTYAKDNTLFGVMGAMGGFMQPMLHVQLVRNLVDCQMDPQESLDAPRWFLHGAGATQSEADMRYSSVLLEEGYGGRCDGQQVQPEQATRSQHLQQEHGDAPTAEGGAKNLRGNTNHGSISAVEADEERVVAAGLTAKGHKVLGVVRGADRNMFGWGHIILRNATTGVLWAGSDPRCDGSAVPVVL